MMFWIMGWLSFPLILFLNHAEYWVETDAAMHSSQFDVWALLAHIVGSTGLGPNRH